MQNTSGDGREQVMVVSPPALERRATTLPPREVGHRVRIGLLVKNRASTIATCAIPCYHPKEGSLFFLGPLGARNTLNKLEGGGPKFFLLVLLVLARILLTWGLR